MNTENLIIYDCCYWEAIEALYKLFPKFKAVPPFTLVIKPVDSIDGAALVVSPQQEEVFGVFYLVG